MALSLTNLTLERGGRTLAQALTFRAEPGAFVALAGPNGSGKTTLLRVIAGLTRPSAGAVDLTGVSAGDRPTRMHLLGHRDGLKPALSVEAHLRFWVGVLGGEADRVPAALAEVGLRPWRHRPARVLSQGQARRLALSRLIVCPRPVWLLDEPAAGLDTAGKALLDRLIQAHLASKGTVIAALHEPMGVTPDATVTLGSSTWAR
jgi:heme exporter protein A